MSGGVSKCPANPASISIQSKGETHWKINDLAWLFFCTCVFLSYQTLDRIMLVLYIVPFYLHPYSYTLTKFIFNRRLLSMDDVMALRNPHVRVTAHYHHPFCLSHTHPLSNLVRNTHSESADEHPLLRFFAAASKDTPGPHGLAPGTQNIVRHVINVRVQVHFMYLPSTNPSLYSPLGPRYCAIHVSIFSYVSTISIDDRLARSWEDEINEHSALPGYHGQNDLFLRAVLLHGMLKMKDESGHSFSV